MQLARTIHVALDLGSPRETLAVSERHLDACAAVGFSAVHLGVCWANHLLRDQPYTIDPSAIDRVKHVVDAARARGLGVVIANVRDREFLENPPRHRARILAQATAVATAFRDQPASVLHEPLSSSDGDRDSVPDTYLAEVLEVTRGIDPDRTLVAGPGQNEDAEHLARWSLPSDRNLVILVRRYFVAGEFFEAAEVIHRVARWARASNRPVVLGIVGASGEVDVTSAARWMRHHRVLAEHHGFAWAFGPGCALYDFERDRWHEELLEALLPGRAPLEELPFTD